MPWCNAFDNHMCIGLTGHWTPCCRFSGDRHYEVNEYSFEEYKNSSFYKELKEVSKESWHPGCIRCQLEEERGTGSYRRFFNQECSGKNHLEYIEISLSNHCNLTCRMCDPTYSTAWGKLFNKNYVIKYDVKELLKNINLQHLKIIKYLGGEPFITPEINDLFEYLDSFGVMPNLTFECNTNCTVFPEKLIHHLKKFKKLFISLSIDGYGKLNDYIRHGKSWNTIETNVLKWKTYAEKNKNVNLQIFSTIQAYNLHDIKNIKNFADMHSIEYSTSLLHEPSHLSINVLPEEYLNHIRDSQNEVFYKSIKDSGKNFKKFKSYTNTLDSIHKTSYKDVIPLLEKYMEKEK